jgi:hypothetical protein
MSQIRLSCGHKVDRANRTDDVGYWCDECGEARMSGQVGTGEHAHAWALELREAVATLGISVRDPGTDRGRALVRALGARIRG